MTALADLQAALAQPGWRGFARLRRYRAENPGPVRALARALRAVDWSARGDLEARRLRVAFVGTGATANLDDALWLEALDRGLVPETLHSGSRQPSRELRDPQGEVAAFGPDVVVVAAEPERGEDPLAAAERLAADVADFRSRSSAIVAVHGFAAPERPAGGLATDDFHARATAALVDRCRPLRDVVVIDLARALAAGGARRWTIHRGRFLAGLALPDEAALPLARDYAALGAARRGLLRKVLALDLDDTLWGGVVGEAGVAGIAIGQDFPGNVHRALQEAALGLQRAGVLLVAVSRNDEEIGWAPFRERSEMVLRREHFAGARIGWGDKAASLRELAAELRLGLDAFVFVDNDPVQRAWVEEQLPEVYVVPASDPLDMLHALAETRVFDGLGRTAEDALRAASYAAGGRRQAEEQAAPDRETFLASLGLVVDVAPARAEDVPRVAQLTQRTNQFNLTTRRYTESEIDALRASPDATVLVCTCRDRFADEGLIGVAVLRRDGKATAIDALLMSCRVLGRGVEHAFAAAILREAARQGTAAVTGTFLRTAKNGLAEGFYRELGFAAQDDAGASWRLDLPAADRAPAWIELRIETKEGA